MADQGLFGLRGQIDANAKLLFGEPQLFFYIGILAEDHTEEDGTTASMGYGAMVTRGVHLPNEVMAVTQRVSPSPKMALTTMLTMLADGLLLKYQQKPAMWAKHGGHKWVKHGLGEYVGDTLGGLVDANEMVPAALVLSR